MSPPSRVRVFVVQGGPVHVGDGAPLTRGDDRTVTNSPLVQALIHGGRLGAIAPEPAKRHTPRTEEQS